MCVCLRKKLNLTCFRQLPETIQHLRCIKFELFHGYPRDGEGNFKLASMFLDQLQHQCIGRQVTFLSHFMKDRLIGVIIIIIMIIPDIEESISSEPKGLMDLEIETNGSHTKRYRFTDLLNKFLVYGMYFLARVLPLHVIHFLNPVLLKHL